MKNSFLILFFILLSFFSTPFFLQSALAAQANSTGTEWYWLTSDQKYGKFFAPTRVRVTSTENSTPVNIEAWIKTAYTPAGAIETVRSMGLKEIANPNTLSYSLALVNINPQGRTIEYKQEVFYDKSGNILASHQYDKPKLKEINSQSFDENFYDAIVDQVFKQGETTRNTANDRWITLWRRVNAQDTYSSTADTTTIRKRDNDLIVWIWQENRSNSGSAVKQIDFYKKIFNLSTYSYKLASHSIWTPTAGWQNKNDSLNGQYSSIIPDSAEDTEYKVLKQYAASHAAWINRYQPTEDTSAATSVKPTVNATAAPKTVTTAPVATAKVTK